MNNDNVVAELDSIPTSVPHCDRFVELLHGEGMSSPVSEITSERVGRTATAARAATTQEVAALEQRLAFLSQPAAEEVSPLELALQGQLQEAQQARAAAEAMRQGALVADDIVGALVMERLRACKPGETLLLDGYPRNERQAASLEREVARAGSAVAAAVWLEVSEPVLVSRLAGRRVCGACAANYHVTNLPPRVAGVCDACGAALIQREDDRPERVANRLVVFREQTAALIDWYAARGLLVRIDAEGDADETTARVARTVMA